MDTQKREPLHSVALTSQKLSNVFGVFVAVSLILHLSVGHGSSLVPHSDDQSCLGLHHAGTTTALSCQVGGLLSWVVGDKHVLLVVHPDSSIRRFSVAVAGSKSALEFLDINFLK